MAIGEGATLKIIGTRATGINKTAFDATWAITDENGVILQPPRPPSADFYALTRFKYDLAM